MPVEIKVECSAARNLVSRISDAYNAKPDTESAEGKGPGYTGRLQKHNDLWRQIESDLDSIARIAFDEGRRFQKEYPTIK